MTSPKREYDLYKDSPVRFLGNYRSTITNFVIDERGAFVTLTGYANELGEALRGFIGSKMVRASYGIATLYVLADTADKTRKTYKQSNSAKRTVFVASDTLIWQMFASVVIPGFAINRVCALTNNILKNRLAQRRQIIVTGVGLAVIPLIINPIDRFVDYVLDFSLRKLEKKI